jgi:hypothetical protein
MNLGSHTPTEMQATLTPSLLGKGMNLPYRAQLPSRLLYSSQELGDSVRRQQEDKTKQYDKMNKLACATKRSLVFFWEIPWCGVELGCFEVRFWGRETGNIFSTRNKLIRYHLVSI